MASKKDESPNDLHNKRVTFVKSFDQYKRLAAVVRDNKTLALKLFEDGKQTKIFALLVPEKEEVFAVNMTLMSNVTTPAQRRQILKDLLKSQIVGYKITEDLLAVVEYLSGTKNSSCPRMADANDVPLQSDACKTVFGNLLQLLTNKISGTVGTSMDKKHRTTIAVNMQLIDWAWQLRYSNPDAGTRVVIDLTSRLTGKRASDWNEDIPDKLLCCHCRLRRPKLYVCQHCLDSFSGLTREQAATRLHGFYCAQCAGTAVRVCKQCKHPLVLKPAPLADRLMRMTVGCCPFGCWIPRADMVAIARHLEEAHGDDTPEGSYAEIKELEDYHYDTYMVDYWLKCPLCWTFPSHARQCLSCHQVYCSLDEFTVCPRCGVSSETSACLTAHIISSQVRTRCRMKCDYVGTRVEMNEHGKKCKLRIPASAGNKAVAIDCEMVACAGSDTLARVSVVDAKGDCLYDSYVAPSRRVNDYRTPVSGIRAENLANAPKFADVRRKVVSLVRDKIVVGHSLSHDENVLQIELPTILVRDTSEYSQCIKPFGGLKPSLKNLANKVFGIDVQSDEHSSIEDAQIAMRIYRKYEREWDKEVASQDKLFLCGHRNTLMRCPRYCGFWDLVSKVKLHYEKCKYTGPVRALPKPGKMQLSEFSKLEQCPNTCYAILPSDKMSAHLKTCKVRNDAFRKCEEGGAKGAGNAASKAKEPSKQAKKDPISEPSSNVSELRLHECPKFCGHVNTLKKISDHAARCTYSGDVMPIQRPNGVDKEIFCWLRACPLRCGLVLDPDGLKMHANVCTKKPSQPKKAAAPPAVKTATSPSPPPQESSDSSGFTMKWSVNLDAFETMRIRRCPKFCGYWNGCAEVALHYSICMYDGPGRRTYLRKPENLTSKSMKTIRLCPNGCPWIISTADVQHHLAVCDYSKSGSSSPVNTVQTSGTTTDVLYHECPKFCGYFNTKSEIEKHGLTCGCVRMAPIFKPGFLTPEEFSTFGSCPNRCGLVMPKNMIDSHVINCETELAACPSRPMENNVPSHSPPAPANSELTNVTYYECSKNCGHFNVEKKILAHEEKCRHSGEPKALKILSGMDKELFQSLISCPNQCGLVIHHSQYYAHSTSCARKQSTGLSQSSSRQQSLSSTMSSGPDEQDMKLLKLEYRECPKFCGYFNTQSEIEKHGLTCGCVKSNPIFKPGFLTMESFRMFVSCPNRCGLVLLKELVELHVPGCPMTTTASRQETQRNAVAASRMNTSTEAYYECRRNCGHVNVLDKIAAHELRCQYGGPPLNLKRPSGMDEDWFSHLIPCPNQCGMVIHGSQYYTHSNTCAKSRAKVSSDAYSLSRNGMKPVLANSLSAIGKAKTAAVHSSDLVSTCLAYRYCMNQCGFVAQESRMLKHDETCRYSRNKCQLKKPDCATEDYFRCLRKCSKGCGWLIKPNKYDVHVQNCPGPRT